MRPDKTQLLKALNCKKGKYIPIAELGVHPIIKKTLLGRDILTIKDDIDFSYKMGYDYIKIQPGADFNPAHLGSTDNILESPDRSVSRSWAREGQGIITNSEEFEHYTFPKTSDFSYARLEEASRYLPEGMGIIGQYGDIFTMTWEMMGFETFSFALFENMELVKKLNDTLGNLVLSMFEVFCQHPAVDAIWYSDDIAYTQSLLVSPETLDDLFFPWLEKIGNLAKQYGKPLIYHTDGVLYDVMDRIINCGVSALHPIEPKAMDIGDVKEKYGKQLCLFGNIDVDLLARGSTDDIRRNVNECITKAALNGGYCLGSGNSIPDYVKIENYLAMIDEAKKFCY